MKPRPSFRGASVYTVGHSTRTLEDLIALLRAFAVSVLVDIRTIPRSRHNPQFNGEALRQALEDRRMRYVHLAELGGLRHAHKDSTNAGWHNASFRGFADYMQTEGFEVGLAKLQALAKDRTVALMCAEAVPWRCHRSLVADALTARGAQVEHITSKTHASPHRMTSFAVVDGTHVTYPGEDPMGSLLETRAPFHLEATVRVLQRRPTNAVDVWDPAGRYLRALSTADGVALVAVEEHGTIEAPELRFKVLTRSPSPATRTALEQTARQLLGLDVDPEPLARLSEAQRRLAPTARALRGMRPPRFAGLFEAFANVVPFQQVSLDAGVAVVGRLVERLGEAVEHDGRRFNVFPSAHVVAEAPDAVLRACGLSRQKAGALRNIARAIEAGELSEEHLSRMSSAAAIRTLTELKGIGPWSAHLVLLRGLGRLDLFPPGDVGARRGLGALTHLTPGPSLDRFIDRFGDHRGYLNFCSLGASLLDKKLIHPAPSRRRRGKK